MKVGYVITMACGVSHWTHREIDILTKHGVEIYAFPLKWSTGPHMPKPGWHFWRPSVARTFLVQPGTFLRMPVKYIKLLALAIRMRTVTEFLLAVDFSREMRRVGVSHIHCHFGDRKLYTGYFCSRLLDLPLSVTVHAYEILCNPNPAMFKLAAAACKWVVTISEFNKREISSIYGVPESKIKVIHCHGDISDERLRTSIKLFIAAEFREKKGHEILFKAVKKLGRKDITIWAAGQGKLDIRKMAEDLGIADQLVLMGEVNRGVLDALYDACDIFVLPSRTASDGDREGIPVSIMEAMSHRKPVISTRHTGIPELVEEVLVDENDVDGLAEAIARLADDPELRARMGERNYEIIKRGFSDGATLQLLEIFDGNQSNAATPADHPPNDDEVAADPRPSSGGD